MPNLLRLVAAANIALLRRLLHRLGPGNRSWLAREVMQDRTDRRAAALADFCGKATLAWKNKQYDIAANGEEALLARLRPFAPGMVLDVGANVGDWSLAACRHLPDAVIHAFEIAPTTADHLRHNARPYPGRLLVNGFGLGERAGDVTLYFSEESTTATSTDREAFAVSARDHGIRTACELTGTITTGDAYLVANGIERVHSLKIDVEGGEWAVLQGLAYALEREAIDLVQFEYGPINLRTRRFLEDFYRFFAERGFAVGKLYPEGVLFKPFEATDEDFVGPNYVACHRSRPDLRDALAWVPAVRL